MERAIDIWRALPDRIKTATRDCLEAVRELDAAEAGEVFAIVGRLHIERLKQQYSQARKVKP